MTLISYARQFRQDAGGLVQHHGANALLAGAGTSYSLTLVNQSAQPWTFYVYQKQPQMAVNVFSLAWFSSPFVIMEDNQITFEWSLDYNFVWSATNDLVPGVTFSASGNQAADLSGSNSTDFLVTPGPHLTKPVPASLSGSLTINDASNVPNKTYSVGIGMSGQGTYVVQAGPNLIHTFTPTPSYWVAAGDNVKIGTVLNINTIGMTAEAKFPNNVYSLKGTLDKSNIWTFKNA